MTGNSDSAVNMDAKSKAFISSHILTVTHLSNFLKITMKKSARTVNKCQSGNPFTAPAKQEERAA